jgi:ABC-type nitrate/sulfonate/bicarbonate transport system permease component
MPWNWLLNLTNRIDFLLILANCWASLQRIFVGVAFAVVVGISLGLVRSSLPAGIKSNKIICFLFDAPKFPPPIAWIPFVLLWFGIGEISAYVIVGIGAFAPIFTNTYEGAESIPSIIRDTAHSLEVRGLGFLIRIVFFASLPAIFTGIRTGIGMAWMAIIASEMIAGQSGLGYSIQLNRLNLQFDLMVIDMILIGTIGFILSKCAIYLERIIIPWHERRLF